MRAPETFAEDDLLRGVTDALSAGGWLWTHVRRSDWALTMGTLGFPDVLAVHPGRRRLLVLELKATTGRASDDQLRWLEAFRSAGVDARLCRPSDYDALVDDLLGERLVAKRRR